MLKLHKIAVAVALATTLAACNQNPTPAASAALPAGIQLVNDHSQTKDGLAIPYKKYQLANGLTVLVHEDNSDPLVHVDVTYHVGSAREEAGKSGFAHFFEHMMFQGSENVADEEHFKIITEAGGNLNGTTNSDRTNYFQTVPVNQLEKVLWLEADRMGFLLDAVTEKKFEVQRETVKNERGQRVDNQPYGRLFERVSQALYPDMHPYSWPVIGWMDDLNRANVNDVKAFFLRWYGPNNATLTIGGDVKAEEILPLVQKYFGTIPVGPAVEPAPKQLLTLSEDRYISMEDNVHLPLLYVTYPSVYARHQDEAALDILAEILGGGNNSLLYKNLVKNQIAVQAQVSHSCAELACNFSLLALPHPASGKNLADIEKVIRDSLVEFEQRGVTDDDLLKVKAKIEADSIFGLQSVQGKVSQLAYNETFFGNPDLIAADIARYNAVTKEDVNRVYQTYLKGKHAVLMSVVPKGQKQLIAKADNFTPVAHNFGGPSTTKAEDLTPRRAVDSFDRSKKPMAAANPAVDVPATWRSSLPNGLEVLAAQSTETPTTSLLLKIPTGLYNETPAQAGISNLLAEMLNESTKNYSTEAMSMALQKLGSQIEFSAGQQYLQVYVSSLTKNLPATLALLEEKLLNPAFDEGDFKRLQQQTLQGLQNAEKNAGFLAQQAYNKLMFGDHISGYNPSGTLQSVSQLTPAQLQAYYLQQLKPQGSQLIVVSDLAEKELKAQLDGKLQQWQGKAPALSVQLPAASAKAGTIYLVDKPDAPQSEIRIGKRSLTEDITGEYFRAGLMNYALGGNFNSRINLNLREDKGYTYGARAGFSGDKFTGLYTASAAVRADATAASIKEFIKEISLFHSQGIQDDELEFMRLAINQSDALKYETPQAKLGFMGRMLEHRLKPDFVKTRNEIVSEISKTELNALAAKHLDPASMTIVVVGDAKKLKPELQALGYPVVDYKL
jgi:zinc protease